MKLLIGFILIISTFLNAQTIAVVDYMKVEPENYLNNFYRSNCRN